MDIWLTEGAAYRTSMEDDKSKWTSEKTKEHEQVTARVFRRTGFTPKATII